MSNTNWLSPEDSDPNRRLQSSELLADLAVRVRNSDALVHSEITGRGVCVTVFVPGIESTLETRDAIAREMIAAVSVPVTPAPAPVADKVAQKPTAPTGVSKSTPDVLGEDASPKVSKG